MPEGTLVELKPSNNTPVLITDKNGERPGSSGSVLLVDTTNLTKIQTGKSIINITGQGSVAVEDEGLHGSAEDWGGSGTGGGLTSCGFGAQLLRNRCCARQNESTIPTCPGQWAYDNTLRRCEFQCDTQDQLGDNPSGQNGGWDTGGSGLGSSNGSGIVPLPGAKPEDPTSAQCINYSPDARSQCCDERLRNPLRIGPRPGFPDCIGRWIFDPRILNCRFQCADYGEMLNILNDLSRNEITE